MPYLQGKKRISKRRSRGGVGREGHREMNKNKI